MLPSHFKNPFVTHTRLYRTSEIYSNINLNSLTLVTLDRIGIRRPESYSPPRKKHEKNRIILADTRYPPIIYRSNLDPLNTDFTKDYCIFDGNHRVLKMIAEGKKAALFFIMTPKCFEGLESFDKMSSSRSTGCSGCSE